MTPGIAGAQVPQVDAPDASTEPAAPPASPEPTQGSAPDIGKGAEEVAAQLRQLTESLSDTAVFSALQAEVDASARRAAERWRETGRLLEGKPRPIALDSLASSWEALRGGLDELSERIEVRAGRREANLETLTKLRESWTRGLDLARKADAPPYVLERAQATLAAIDSTRPAIEQRRASILVLQDAVSRSLQTCDDALARIGEERREAVARIVVQQEPPVWSGHPSPGTRPAGPAGGEVAAKIDSLRIYGQTYGVHLALSVLLVVVLMAGLRRGRSEIESLVARDPAFESAASVFRTPYAAAILLGLLFSRPLRPNPPIALQQITVAIATLAAVSVLRPVIEARLIPAVYAFAALFVVNLARETLEMPPRLEQVILIVEMGATMAILLWAAAQLREFAGLASPTPRLRAFGRTFLFALAFGCGASGVAAALGYVEMADFLGVGLFYLLFAAFALLAVRVAADGLVTIGFVRGPFARLRAVAHHRAVVERRVRRFLDVATVALWIFFALSRFGLLEPTGAVLQSVLDARLRVGELDLAFGRVLGFAAVVVGAYLTTRFVVFLLEEDVYSRMALPRGVPYALTSLTRYAFLLAGFLLALATLGLDLTRITVLVSAFGVGIGFGLQQIINNFVSGLILLFERPVKVGDSVQLGELSGDVLRIGIRSSTVRTSQGAEVIIPNSKMIEEKVTNWTLSDRRRRIDLDITVGYDTDSERVLALLIDVARRDPRVSTDPAPDALLVRFGDDSADFELRVWTDDPHWMRLRSDLGVALQKALRDARVRDSSPPEGKERAS